MQEIPETQLPKPEADRRNNECIIGQKRNATASRGMKVEPDYVNLSPTEELAFLRSRVQELEREKAEMAAENQRLKDMLVNEIPSLLSSMKQTMSICATKGNSLDFAQPHSVVDGAAFTQPMSAGMGRVDSAEFVHTVSACARKAEHAEFMQVSNSGRRPEGVEYMQTVPANMEDDGEYVVTDEDGGVVCPVVITDEDCHTCPSSACSSPDLPPARDCSEMEHLHVSGRDRAHVRQVEVYPGSSVFCEARAWHAAIQAQSPTAMARTLLLGVFDMDTLLHSNLRGGRSRRPTFPNHRAGLDPHKLDAIYNATLAKFPLARKGQIGTGINSKLSEIRFKSRRASRERRGLYTCEDLDVRKL
ncbi:uncharacterized protein LOC118790494 [Megalops cyprinoides]|uniref:uncharacterized protein LOC118790494 n=1 Tax=Megalops cyprinoides TaxID=118141 RepID=UPI001863AD47|nr:uncharacterized protein LOC118790494 [Megalops cyprinoides]